MKASTGELVLSTGLRPKVASFLIVMAIGASSLLLPVEYGLPPIGMFGAPIPVTFLISLACLVYLVVSHHTVVNKSCLNSIMALQLLMVSFFSLGALRSLEPGTAYLRCLAYVTCYCVDYAVLRTVCALGYGRFVFRTVAMCGVLMAGVGIAEGFGFHFEFYSSLFNNAADYIPEANKAIRSRVLGTVGNPIVYSAALGLCLPFVFQLRGTLFKVLATGGIIVASSLAMSRTALLLVAPLIVGATVVLRRRLIVPVIVGLCALVVLCFTPVYDSAIQALEWRLEDRRNSPSTSDSLAYRAEAVASVLANTTGADLVLGRGLRGELEISDQIDQRVGTLDNNYASILVDLGLLGFATYLLVYGFIIYRIRWQWCTSMLFYGVLGYLLAGLSFVTYFYHSIGFLMAAQIACLASDRCGRTIAPASSKAARPFGVGCSSSNAARAT